MGGTIRSVCLAILAAAAFAIASLVGCEPAPPPVDVGFLAADAHFGLGGQRYVLPFVAIERASNPVGYSNTAFGSPDNDAGPETVLANRASALKLAGDPAHPFKAGFIQISSERYGYVDKQGAAVCPRLTRVWARLVCRGEPPGKLGDLPKSFQLFDRAYLNQLRQHFTVGRESRFEQVTPVGLQEGATKLGCDKATRFCTAALALSSNVVAVWGVEATPTETAAEMARRHGAAICVFARDSIGEIEAFERLVADRPCRSLIRPASLSGEEHTE